MDTTPPDDLRIEQHLVAQQALLRRLARAVARDEASADDLAQDAVVLALGWGGPAPRAWLARVVRRLARTERRAAARRNRREREAARSEHQPPDQETLARRLDLQAWLGARLRALPHEQAHALALRYGEDLAPGEIARHLGVPEATVKTRLRRGLAALREGLDTEHGREEWRLALAPTLATSGYDAGPDVGHEVGSCKPGAHTAPAGGAAHAGATLAGFGGLAGALLVAAAAVVGVLFVGLWGGAPDDGVAAGRSALAPRVEARSPPTASIVERAPLDELTVASDGPGGAPSIATSSIRSEASSPDDLTTSGIEPVSTALPSEPAGAGTATVRVIFEHDSLDDEARRALAGKIAYEVEGHPRRELELRGELRRATVEREVPAERTLRIAAALDGYDTPPVDLRTPAAGESVDVLLSPAPMRESVELTLLLGFARGTPIPEELEGQRWLVSARHANGVLEGALAMPMRTVTVRDGRLVYGRMPCGEYLLHIAPYGAISSGATEMLLGHVTVSLDTVGESRVPVLLHRSGTITLVARDVDGTGVQARASVTGPDGASRMLSFRFDDGATAYHGPTTHRTLRASARPPLLPGRYTLQVTCDGHLPAQREVIVRSGEVVDLDVMLEPLAEEH